MGKVGIGRGSPIDDSGTTINNIVIVKPVERIGRSKQYDCICFCGKSFVTFPEWIIAGNVRSCGCLRASNCRKIGAQALTLEHSKIGIERARCKRRIEAGMPPDLPLHEFGLASALREISVPLVLKKFVKQLYGKCCLCGEEQILQLHHILPVANCIWEHKLHLLYALENLVVLCRSCHFTHAHSGSAWFLDEKLLKKFKEIAQDFSTKGTNSEYLSIKTTIETHLTKMNFEEILFVK